jgi:hypothetical protein
MSETSHQTTEPIMPSKQLSNQLNPAKVDTIKGKLATEFVPSILDREVADGSSDAFGHRHFADALRGLIEAPEHKPPYSIGLLGGWGTGKSSVKAMYLKGLEDSTGPDARSKKVRSITFNAWRFGGEDIRRALLRDVFIQLGGNEATIHDQFFSQTSQILIHSKRFVEMFRESWERLLWIFFQIACIFAFSILMTAVVAHFFKVDAIEYYSWLTATFFAVSALAFKVLEKAVVNRYTDVTKIELPKASAEQFEKLLKDHLLAWKKTEKTVERLVIFVDDLDRLSSEEMVDGLDAIRALMELPTGGAGVGVVFVISCDEGLVADALSKRAKTAPELPGAISSRQDARRYLDRIFQFRLDIPPTPRMDMRSFATDLLKRDCFEQVVGQVIASGSSIEEVVSRMIHVGVQNPRNAIQIVNAFAASMWIATKREFEGSRSSRAGALIEGAVTSHPISLAVLSALKVDFPDFFRILQSEPGALEGFVHVFIRGGDPNEIPGSVSSALKPFANSSSESSAKTWKIDDRFLPLRQFVSSVQAVRFPDSLLPLMLLSQDEVSRRTGDAGARLYDPVVSGDVSGVLKALGRDSDERPLELHEVESLFGIWELVETDSQDRRENAGLVLAKLVGRCRQDQARKLAVPIAATIVSSLSLRNRLGPDHLKPLFSLVRDSDRVALHQSVFSDYGLESESHVIASSSQGKDYSLEEAIAQVQIVAEMLLNEWEEGKLGQRHRDTLTAWMMDRTVSTLDQAERVIPFKVIDEWVTKHESILLPSLGIEYGFAVCTEMANEEPSLFDKEKAIERMLIVLSQHRTHPRFWELVSEVSQLNEVDCCLAAQKIGRSDLSSATQPQVAAWAGVLAKRVERFAPKELHDDDIDAVKLLTELCVSHASSLKKVSPELRDCIIALSKFDGNGQHAVNLFGGLRLCSKGEWSEVVVNWFERLPSDLPASCAAELGRNLDMTEVEPMLTARTTALRSTATKTSERHGALEAFWEAAEEQQGMAASTVQLELSSILQTMTASFASFETTESFWPVFRIALHKSSEASGSRLDTLLSQSKPTPASFISVMRFLEHELPLRADLAPLTGGVITAHALQVISGLAPSPEANKLLGTLLSFVQSVDLEEAEQDAVVTAISVIWGNFPQVATELLILLPSRLSINNLSLICDQWQTDPDNLLPHFAVAQDLTEEKLVDLFEFVAERPAVSANGINDSAIVTFVEAVTPEQARKVVLGYVSDNTKLVENRRRVLLRAQGLVSTADHEWVMRSILSAASIQLASFAQDSVKIIKAKTTDSMRHDLSLAALSSLATISSVDEKRILISAMAELGGQGASEAYAKSTLATLEDVTLLKEVFPRSKKLENARKKLQKND